MVMLKRPTCIDLQDRQGRSPLHVAVSGGHLDSVQCLIKYGADVDLRAATGLDRGRSSLHMACLGGFSTIVDLLLTNGAIVNATDAEVQSPLHLAAREGRLDCIAYLLGAGAQCDLQDRGNKTALHVALDERHGPSKEQQNVARQLVPYTNLDLKDWKGRTPLHLASRWNCGELLTLMLAMGADVNAKDKNDHSALHYAFMNQDNIALHSAQVLLTHGADTQLAEKRHSPLHVLINHKKATDPYVQDMMKEWAKLRTPNDFGNSLLHLAVIGGHADMVRFLLACGVSATMEDSHGCQPLHLAVIGGRCDIMRMLITKGAEVNMRDADGMAPLHYAAALPKPSAIKLLLSQGASVNVEDIRGCRPIHKAVGARALQNTKLFVEAGADLCAMNSEGQKAIHIAHAIGDEKIAEYLQCQVTNLDAVSHSSFRTSDQHVLAAFKQEEMVECLNENKSGAKRQSLNYDDGNKDIGKTSLSYCQSVSCQNTPTTNVNANLFPRGSLQVDSHIGPINNQGYTIADENESLDNTPPIAKRNTIVNANGATNLVAQQKRVTFASLNCLKASVSIEEIKSDTEDKTVSVSNDELDGVPSGVNENSRLLEMEWEAEPESEVHFYPVESETDCSERGKKSRSCSHCQSCTIS